MRQDKGWRDIRGESAIKFIVAMGLLTVALLWGGYVALERALPSGERGGSPPPAASGPAPSATAPETGDDSQMDAEARRRVDNAQSPFDGERAYADLERVVGFGPRPAGSEALEELREFMRATLEAEGFDVWEHAFTADTPIGLIDMVNVVAPIQGTEPGVIVLGNHYETKYYEDITFVGANDGGSTTAWMLEMARVLGPEREGRSVWLCFFDGEESFEDWTEEDSLYGSRAFVGHLAQTGELANIDAMVNVDMIGDCVLTIERDQGAPDWLQDIIWDEASALGHGEHFLDSENYVLDDHIPFRRAGVPAMVVIDFMYGGTPQTHVQYWHTEEDTLDKVCAQSLQVVGDVIYHALPRIDGALDEMAQSS